MLEVMMNKRMIGLVLLLGLLMLIPELADACPNCKEAYSADGQTPISSGFNASIVFMMIMPFLVLGGFILRLWTAQKRKAQDVSHG
jgi:hypothetical protein